MEITVNNHSKQSFTSLKPIPKLAKKIGGNALQEATPELERLAKDVDMEIVPKKGFFSKIKSLIFFVTNKDEKLGRFFSLSIDPKNYMQGNNATHYKQVDCFTKENILEAASAAKELNKKGMKVPKKSVTMMPADAVILAKFMQK